MGGMGAFLAHEEEVAAEAAARASTEAKQSSAGVSKDASVTEVNPRLQS